MDSPRKEDEDGIGLGFGEDGGLLSFWVKRPAIID